MQKFKTILLSLFLIFPAVNALCTEAQHFSIKTVKVCNFTLAYNDKGSGGDEDISLFIPEIPEGYFMLGGYAQGDYHPVNNCVIAAKPAASNLAKNSILMKPPDDLKLIWTDKGSGADRDGSVWHPVTVNSNYYCIGSIGQAGYGKPFLPEYRCLHKCLLEQVPVPEPLWTDRNTGAKFQISMYKLENSGFFFAKSGRNKPATLVDLKSNPVCNMEMEISLDKPVEKKITPDKNKVRKPGPSENQPNEWVNPDDL